MQKKYYREFENFKENISKDKNILEFIRKIENFDDAKLFGISIEEQNCVVKEDWIEEIENKLIFVEKAVAEERQFIQSNGEVVAIEKARNVSRESVTHLAKHANLIREVDEEEAVKPEKIYTVERLSDYTVYENKFLYYLLCYLQDFVTQRYDAVSKNSGKSYICLKLENTLKNRNRNIKYEIKIEDDNTDYMAGTKKVVIKRLENILSIIIKLLASPLMIEVSKVAMIKPPITKTNTLRMNNNFKNALALYEYIASYNGKGYEIVRQSANKDLNKEDKIDFAHVISLLLFTLRMHAEGQKEILQQELDEEIKAEKQKAQQDQKDRIAKLKQKLKEEKIDIHEYILELEKELSKVTELEVSLSSANAEIDKLNATILNNQENIMQNNKEIAKLNVDIKKAEEAKEKFIEQKAQEISALKDHISSLDEEKAALVVSNSALKHSLGMTMEEDAYSQENNFKNIEKEYLTIKKLYKVAWKKTRRRIFNEIFKAGAKDEKQKN